MPSGGQPVGKVTKFRWTASPAQIAAKQAERRTRLPETNPIVWSHCSKAVVRLFDFSNERRDEITYDGLQEAGEAVLEAVQDELRTQRSPLPLSVASELAISRLWAIHALSVLTGSYAHAKRYELQVTSGAPLAVCIGTGPWFPPVSGFRKLKKVRSYWGEVSIPAAGCHAIMAESTRFGGVMWRYWCDDCAPNKGAKVRAQARRHKRLVDGIHEARSTPEGYARQ
jgi:hypothetical protein